MNIKDYLHLYLGCDVETPDGIQPLVSIHLMGKTKNVLTLMAGRSVTYAYNYNEVKPILRPLSDMTEQEAKIFFGLHSTAEVYSKINHGSYTEFLYKWEDEERIYDTSDGKGYSAVGIGHSHHVLEILQDQFLFLLSKHFDLFGLIDAGLAIDKTTLNSDKNDERIVETDAK